MWSTWVYRVMHNTCITHGRGIKTQYIGLTLILLLRKDWISIRLDRMQSFFKKHFQLIVFHKLLDWRLEESYTKKHTCHRRPPLKISSKHEWKRELGSEDAQRSEDGQLSKSFQSNQPILNPIRERTGRPVIRDDSENCARWKKNVPFSRRSMLILFTKNLFLQRERGDSSLKQTQKNVPDSSRTRSVHESGTFNVGDKTLRERTERPVIDHDNLSHEKIMVKRGGHGLPNSRATTFCCEACAEYQRSRIDSEKWEPPRSTRSSTRSTTKSGI